MNALSPLFISLLLLLTLLRTKIGLGWAFLVSTVSLIILSGEGFLAVVETFKATVTGDFFLEIIGILFLINLMEELMRNGGYFDRGMSALNSLFKERLTITAVFPALMGLLPAFGGARFSAPMVELATTGLCVDETEKSLLNYWFRHIWEYISPLYPGVILAVYLVGVETGRFILYMLPFPFLAVLLGFFFFLRPVISKNRGIQERTAATAEAHKTATLKRLLVSLWPVEVILLATTIFKVSILWPMLFVDLALYIQNHKKTSSPWLLWKKVFPLQLGWMCFGIFFFKTAFEKTGLPQILPKVLSEAGVPDVALLIILPIVMGVITGLLSGFVGISFPLLMPFLVTDAGVNLPAMILAYVAGHVGTMLSPLHFCMILTLEYFKAELLPVWIRLTVPQAIMLLSAVVWSVFLGLSF